MSRPDITSRLKEQMRDALVAGFGDRIEGTPCEDVARHPEHLDLLVNYFSAFAGEQGLGMRAEALERRLDETRELVRLLYRHKLHAAAEYDLTEEQAQLAEEIVYGRR